MHQRGHGARTFRCRPVAGRRSVLKEPGLFNQVKDLTWGAGARVALASALITAVSAPPAWTNNQVLTSLSLPRLAQTNMLIVGSNPALHTLSTQVLTSVLSRLIVNSNDNLPLCSVQQLVSRLRAEPFVWFTSDAEWLAFNPAADLP